MAARVKRVSRDDGPPVRLMLDSGAFSAWRLGGEVDIDEYIDYIKENERYIETYINLDMIPGKFGKKRTQAEVEESARVSYENLQYMKKKGLHPIPVFHHGERFYWLERMLKDGEKYIALSTSKARDPMRAIPWLDDCFTRITNDKGELQIKVHGMGITNLKLLMRYPWTTADSSTWIRIAANGMCIIPHYRNGAPYYGEVPLYITMSHFDGIRVNAMPYCYDDMGPLMQKTIRHYIEEVAKVPLAATRYDQDARAEVNLVFFDAFEASMSKERLFKHRVTRRFL